MAAAGRIILAIGCLLLATPAFGSASGEDLYKEVLASTGAYEDSELTAYLEGLVRDIVSVSEMAGEEFTFTLVDSGDINAFATAGNYVYINRGILNYIRNEAQLVSVLAHEVGHITQRHVSVMPAVAGGASFLSWLAGALSGSMEVYQAGQAYANSLLKGHGRDNELQADESAARYMAKLGYDPNEMLEMLTVMKDLEIMQKERAAKGGAPRRAYHGIFSSHPRNDMRLRSAVSKSKNIETSATRDSGAERYRQVTEGLVWGENFKEKEQKAERWSDRKLRVRFDYPDGWTHQVDSQLKAVVGQPEDGAARLSMQTHPRTPQDPEEYLYNHLKIPQLRDGKEVKPARLKGYTGILPGQDGQADQRVAVVFYKLNAFLFIGEVAEPSTFDAFDEHFLESIDTFRPISNREIEGQRPQTIHWVKATEATTFDGLGEYLKLTPFEVQDLRLINGYYPSGEPKPGEWIRFFRQE
ncbi:MAG: M48 family metalloprotease [Xanthomonadales bacterium]|nr:M48 family metalloprotease [Xanthomonadales bacterium]